MDNRKHLHSLRTITILIVMAALMFLRDANAAGSGEVGVKGVQGETVNEVQISAEELALMLTQQKLLATSFLAMQQQLKQMQDDLAEVKVQLAQSDVNASTVAVKLEQLQSKADSAYVQNGLFAAIGLGVGVLVMWLGLRKRPAHGETLPQQDTGQVVKPTIAPQKVWASNGIKQPSHVQSDQAPLAVIPPKPSSTQNVAAPLTYTPPPKPEEKISEEDSMLEEAKLYAANGRLVRAVEILLEFIKQFPTKVEAWTLLLSLYSSLGKATEFENTAREFLRHHKASPFWGQMQMLGRTLDHDNPLYADHESHSVVTHAVHEAENLHHPIGDILMDMGVLSKQEVSNYLKEFDPKKHGRFGGYLVARKAITLAQLDLALMQQEGINVEFKPDTLPSLQQVENFLTSFDPKQHESVAKFMASCNAVTPEQISKVLQQHSNREGANKHGKADEARPLEKVAQS